MLRRLRRAMPKIDLETPRFQSLYVHFPFCETKCHYCDFYSLGRERTREGDPSAFEAALHREALLWRQALAPRIETIFFGGGTPSMTDPSAMEKALEPLALASRIHSGTEWTMEANPSSIDVDRLRDYRNLGVNRISMGVQAMRDDLLLRLGRVHSRDAALRGLEAIFKAGFQRASVDLLCGVPGQTERDIEEAIEQLTQFPITHLSCYLLTLPEHHRMFRELPNEDGQLSHLMTIHHAMTRRGFRHYEISNYALPGEEARHNLVYWKGGAYLGLGPSAHSFDPGTAERPPHRWKNRSSLHSYGEQLHAGRAPTEQIEELSLRELELERWLLALRLDEGFPRTWLDTDARRKKAEALQKEGLLENHPDDPSRLRLSPRGLALSDGVIEALS